VAVLVGTSGWSYQHWNGVLYPPGSRPADRLEIYAAQFDTVELNASFYRWPPPHTFAAWRDRLPAGFAFSAKAPRGLTHAKQLKAPEAWTERIRSSWHELGEHRGVLLVQLGPNHARDDSELDYFLGRLPAWIQVAVEFRHPSWHQEETFSVLERHQAAYCVMSGAKLPCILRATSKIVYVRLHGPSQDHLYADSYPLRDLQWWADRIHEWNQAGHDVFAYFNNDGEGHAVRNAITLNGLLEK
jgi:uncharacterized protein YecE (DUF72 family)